MQIIEQIIELKAILKGFSGKKITLVPTMGNLHAGHLGLVEEAKKLADIVVCSIFVNPLQFGENEDFAAYPRTFAADCEALKALNVDVLFSPSTAELYPEKQSYLITPESGVANDLEGKFRPGHFTGVATVVAKLFNLVSPDFAIFGKKDYQQLHIIENMVKQLAMPINIIRHETLRSSDGLALSSRNSYLSHEERKLAPKLYSELINLRNKLLTTSYNSSSINDLCNLAMSRLDLAGWKSDYISVRKCIDLGELKMEDGEINFQAQPAVILAASRLGKTRLIDNIEI